jgi:hypothetical protein
MEHMDLLKLEINYGRAGASFVTMLQTMSSALWPSSVLKRAGLSSAERTSSVGMQRRHCDLVYIYIYIYIPYGVSVEAVHAVFGHKQERNEEDRCEINTIPSFIICTLH